MDELFAFLDLHELAINFTRSPPDKSDRGRMRWYASIWDIRYEVPDSLFKNGDTVHAFGETQEEAAERCLEIIRTKRCFRVVLDTNERRVLLEVGNV